MERIRPPMVTKISVGVRALSCKKRTDVSLVLLYLLIAPPLQLVAVLAGPLPWMNYGHGWASAIAYWMGVPGAAYLLWRRNPRARMATYIFLSFDAVRSLTLAHPLPLAVDVAIVLYLQTAPMRRLYPSMWSRTRVWRRRTFSP